MKLYIFIIIWIILLLILGLDVIGFRIYFDDITEKTIDDLVKIIASIGLIFLLIRYFREDPKQRNIPWDMVIIFILLGFIINILNLFNIFL